MQIGNLKILSVDIAAIPNQQVEVITGIIPKVQCKNQFIQRLLIKLFGYKVEYKTVDAKVVKIKASDFPKNNVNPTLSFTVTQ